VLTKRITGLRRFADILKPKITGENKRLVLAESGGSAGRQLFLWPKEKGRLLPMLSPKIS
jgi:hypothetical protein